MEKFEVRASKRKTSFNAHRYSAASQCSRRAPSSRKLVNSNTIVPLSDLLRTDNSISNIDQRKQLMRLLTDTTKSSHVASLGFHSLIQDFQTAATQNIACFKSISRQTADYRANQDVLNQTSENLRKDILAVKMNFETGNFETKKRLDLTSQSLDSLGDTVHRLSIGFSESQIKTLKSMITGAQSQTPTRVPKDSCSISQREDREALDAKSSTEADRRLTLSLSRLARIACDTRTVAPSEEARSVLEALKTIVELMVNKGGISNSPNLKRKTADVCDSMINKAEHGHEHRRIRSLLSTSQSIVINPIGI